MEVKKLDQEKKILLLNSKFRQLNCFGQKIQYFSSAIF